MTTTITANANVDLGYKINDADNHFNEPPDCFERYIDPKNADLAIRYVKGPDGERMQLFAGKPSKFHSETGHLLQGRAGEDARRHLQRSVRAGRRPRSRAQNRNCRSCRACSSTGSTL